MYIVFDTETTGLPKNYNAPLSDLDNWPRMVQIAWQIYNKDGVLLEEKMFIVKPEGYTIPKEASDVHGITTERAIAEGHDLEATLNEFRSGMLKAEYLVAHNISFDEKIVGAEFIRKKISPLAKKLERLDTMTSSTNYCKLPNRRDPSKFKFPNLTELHKKLFNIGFDGAHDALADVSACARCLFELKKLGIINK